MSFFRTMWCNLMVVALATSIAAGEWQGGNATGRTMGHEVAANNPYQSVPRLVTNYLWNDTDWDEYGRTTATRDNLGRVTNVFSEIVVSGQWRNSADITLTYSTNEGPDTATTTIWQGVWVFSNRTIYKYDKEGRVGEEVLQFFTGGAYQNSLRTTYTFDPGGNLTLVRKENWQSGWTDESRTEYTYAGAQLIEALESTWVNGAWMPFSRETYAYSAGFLSQEVTEFWSGSEWVPETRSTYTYTGGLIETVTIEEYFNSSWQNSGQMIYELYDDQGRVLVAVQMLWDGSSFINLSKDVYEYDTPTSVVDGDLVVLPNGTSLAPNYPNPFNPSTVISFQLPVQSQVTLEIFDMLGRRVAEVFSGVLSAGDHVVEWNGQSSSGSPAATGVYFYRLTTQEGSLSRKMLLVK